MKEKAVVLVSGGMDSATLIRWMQNHGYDVHGLSINYGQRHKVELHAAGNVCQHLDVPWRVADLTVLRQFIARGALTGDAEVPEGHYEDESMKQTVVPNRNMILLSIAAGYAIQIEARSLGYAAHAGDHAIYPDCRVEFADAMEEALKLCDFEPVKLLRPFVMWTKSDIAKYGARHKVPYEMTWSCYKGGTKHCGKCGTCVERREAFVEAGVPDPTEYEE